MERNQVISALKANMKRGIEHRVLHWRLEDKVGILEYMLNDKPFEVWVRPKSFFCRLGDSNPWHSQGKV